MNHKITKGFTYTGLALGVGASIISISGNPAQAQETDDIDRVLPENISTLSAVSVEADTTDKSLSDIKIMETSELSISPNRLEGNVNNSHSGRETTSHDQVASQGEDTTQALPLSSTSAYSGQIDSVFTIPESGLNIVNIRDNNPASSGDNARIEAGIGNSDTDIFNMPGDSASGTTPSNSATITDVTTEIAGTSQTADTPQIINYPNNTNNNEEIDIFNMPGDNTATTTPANTTQTASTPQTNNYPNNTNNNEETDIFNMPGDNTATTPSNSATITNITTEIAGTSQTADTPQTNNYPNNTNNNEETDIFNMPGDGDTDTATTPQTNNPAEPCIPTTKPSKVLNLFGVQTEKGGMNIVQDRNTNHSSKPSIPLGSITNKSFIKDTAEIAVSPFTTADKKEANQTKENNHEPKVKGINKLPRQEIAETITKVFEKGESDTTINSLAQKLLSTPVEGDRTDNNSAQKAAKDTGIVDTKADVKAQNSIAHNASQADLTTYENTSGAVETKPVDTTPQATAPIETNQPSIKNEASKQNIGTKISSNISTKPKPKPKRSYQTPKITEQPIKIVDIPAPVVKPSDTEVSQLAQAPASELPPIAPSETQIRHPALLSMSPKPVSVSLPQIKEPTQQALPRAPIGEVTENSPEIIHSRQRQISEQRILHWLKAIELDTTLKQQHKPTKNTVWEKVSKPDTPTLGAKWAIKEGDSAWSIARQLWGDDVSWELIESTWIALLTWNPELKGSQPYDLPDGVEIVIPADVTSTSGLK